jgi:hypothetical protein
MGKVLFPVHRRDTGAKLSPGASFRFGSAFGYELHLIGEGAGGLAWPDTVASLEVIGFHLWSLVSAISPFNPGPGPNCNSATRLYLLPPIFAGVPDGFEPPSRNRWAGHGA